MTCPVGKWDWLWLFISFLQGAVIVFSQAAHVLHMGVPTATVPFGLQRLSLYLHISPCLLNPMYPGFLD